MTELEKLTKRKCWNIVADIWLKDYIKDIENNNKNIQSSFAVLKGFIWGLYCANKISESKRDLIINELLDMWQ